MVVQVDNTLEIEILSRLTDIDSDDYYWAEVEFNEGLVFCIIQFQECVDHDLHNTRSVHHSVILI